ncbi:uncharacterized protein LOC143596234 [Bidens hawaiensis]|uniref:uncharacterized protein LOC143596234 n=1 Tax=Bidens hawaiensis TaxID=980011 RepID=UPI00404B71D2
MVHQEDAGLNAEMAKMIFAKGIWSYVCKMDNALRKYSPIKRMQLTSTVSAITFVQKVPLLLDSTNAIADMAHPEVFEECNKKKLSRRPSKKFIANGLIIAGGVICLARGHTNFNAKVAMAYMLSKLTKRREPSLHISDVIFELDLKFLMDNLDDNNNNNWKPLSTEEMIPSFNLSSVANPRMVVP